MTHRQPEDTELSDASSSGDDLSTYLLNRLAIQKQELEVNKLFRALVRLKGSDLHLKVGSPPMIRINGELRSVDRGPIESEEIIHLTVPMMDERNQSNFSKEWRCRFCLFLRCGWHHMEISRQRLDTIGQCWIGRSAYQQLDP